jgi:hypothetical protein
MAQYQPSYVDVSGFSKAISDAAYKAQQLAVKNEQMLARRDAAIDDAIKDEYKIYSGKLRKTDLAKFDSYFNDYKLAKTEFQKLNRTTGGSALTEASARADMARQRMVDFIDRSTAIGSIRNSMAQTYKDPAKVVNRNLFLETLSNIDSKDADEIVEQYESIDKIPKVFDLKLKDFDTNGYINTVQKLAKIKNPSLGRGTKPMPKIDPNTGQQSMRTVSIPGYGSEQVPQMTIQLALSPEESFEAVMRSAVPGTVYQDVPRLFKNDLDERLKSDNPQIKQSADADMKKTMEMFGISDPSQVTGYHLVATMIAEKDPDKRETVIDDWSTWKTWNSAKMAAKNFKLRSAIEKQANESGIKDAQKIMQLLSSASSLGVLGDADWSSYIKGVITNVRPELKIDDKTISSFSQWKLKNAQMTTDASMMMPWFNPYGGYNMQGGGLMNPTTPGWRGF